MVPAMKSAKHKGMFRPFEGLKSLLDKKSVPLKKADIPSRATGSNTKADPEQDRALFEVAKRLHRGEFSIQGHIDLHGLSVESAQDAFEKFLKESIAVGKRMVLIVHGRGLSSPAKPILKTNVFKWLTTGPWRKWIMAFASARLCDGGAGATYVLLRKRPVTKRYKKGRR
jgi:DNA-nicking Smr family endonuclease